MFLPLIESTSWSIHSIGEETGILPSGGKVKEIDIYASMPVWLNRRPLRLNGCLLASPDQERLLLKEGHSASSEPLKPPSSTHPSILRSLPLSLPGRPTDMTPTRTTSVTGIRRKFILMADSHKKTQLKPPKYANRVTRYPCQRHQAPHEWRCDVSFDKFRCRFTTCRQSSHVLMSQQFINHLQIRRCTEYLELLLYNVYILQNKGPGFPSVTSNHSYAFNVQPLLSCTIQSGMLRIFPIVKASAAVMLNGISTKT